ncbi:MAG: hypothetical protein FJX76_03840 [Armatimonadetes bacterium]|nr:hypothetical protein [Armatimonadota bacterium]
MIIPTVKSATDLGVRKEFSATIEGAVDTGSEALVQGKLEHVNADLVDIASRCIERDGSADDRDPRPGFVAVANLTGSRGHTVLEGVAVQFDVNTRKPLEMSRHMQSGWEETYTRGTSRVVWNADGTLSQLDEYRCIERLYNHSTSETRVSLSTAPDGTRTYEEFYKRS